MSKRIQSSLEATIDEEDNELFFWDSLLDLHDRAKDIIAERMARLKGK